MPSEVYVNPSTESAERPRTVKPDGVVTVIVTCCGLLFLDCDSLDGTAEYLEGLAAGAPVRIETARVPADPPVGPAKKDDTIPIRGAFVALLNNDTIVTQSWLESLTGLACAGADIGMVAPMSNHAAQALLVDPIPYGIDDLPGRNVDPQRDGDARPQRLLAQIEKVNAFARDWKEKNRGQSFEADTLAGGCVLLKREVLQKLGLFPTRTPLGIFDMEALGLRVRQSGYRLAACRELFIHNFGSRGQFR